MSLMCGKTSFIFALKMFINSSGVSTVVEKMEDKFEVKVQTYRKYKLIYCFLLC